jgi:two-component sensor histidine kinase
MCRPSTGPTLYHDDVVGVSADESMVHELTAAWKKNGIRASKRTGTSRSVQRINEVFVPVIRRGKVIAVLSRPTRGDLVVKDPSMESNYISIANVIMGMITRGEFPTQGSISGQHRGDPRVGDGVIRIDAEGFVTYVSPNGMSNFRRLGLAGNLVNHSLIKAITDHLEKVVQIDEAVPVVAMGKAPWLTDIEANGATVSLRSLPLTDHGVRTGALILCRDVSDLRRREREMLTKDATIREIHHRVKNNLQTVTALLRLQRRRVELPEAQASLDEAIRRVGVIASIHESLSRKIDESVEFDEIIGHNLRMAADVAAVGMPVEIVQKGSFGRVDAQDATPLALILTELVTNAVEHGLVPKNGGTVWVEAQREGQHLVASVLDNGVGNTGLAAEGHGLGTQIIHSLVEGELRGKISWGKRDEGGTKAVIETDLR